MKHLIDFFYFSEKLKNIKRATKLSNGSRESVADHSWHLGLLSLLLHDKVQDDLNLEKVLKIVLVHDLAEAETGDLYLENVLKNPDLKIEKAKEEKEVMEKVKNDLGKKGDEIYQLWEEYENQTSKEAKFVKTLDKFEALIQGYSYKDVNYWDPIYFPYILKEDGMESYCKDDPYLKELFYKLKEEFEMHAKNSGLDMEKYKD